MPLKRTVYRGKHAITTLISVSIAGLIGLGLSVIVGLSNWKSVNTTYFGFALAFLGINAFFAPYFVFVARKNKGIYLASIISAFVICEAFAVFGIVMNNLVMLHIGWLLPFTLFFYILAEIYDDGSIHARIWGPISALVLATVILIWPVVDGPKDYSFFRIAGIVIYAIGAIIMLIYFIAFLVCFKKKNAYDELTLGSSKFSYDVDTPDEAAISTRRYSTDFEELQSIPRLYEGEVWRIDDEGITNIARYIRDYIDECIETINYMLSLAKVRITTVEDYNSFVDQYNTWVKNLKTDRDQMIDFLKKIANVYFLDLDNGTSLHFDFYKYQITREDADDKDSFYVRISGFTRTFRHPKAMFGKDKVAFSVPNSYWKIIKCGYHAKEEDSAAGQHGYHLPGTPMPEED